MVPLLSNVATHSATQPGDADSERGEQAARLFRDSIAILGCMPGGESNGVFG